MPNSSKNIYSVENECQTGQKRPAPVRCWQATVPRLGGQPRWSRAPFRGREACDSVSSWAAGYFVYLIPVDVQYSSRIWAAGGGRIAPRPRWGAGRVSVVPQLP